MALAMSRRALLLPGLLALALSCWGIPPATSAPSVHYPGRWTPPSSTWGSIAVHLALVRDTSDTYHSRIVWWNSEDQVTFHGGLWGWKPDDTDSCKIWPADADMHPMSLHAPGFDPFCGAQVQTWDGRLLVAGGTEHGEVGIDTTEIYDPNQDNWSSAGVMSYSRWYATTTALPNKHVLISSGTEYDHMLSFGGKASGGSTLNADLRRLGLLLAGHWDAGITTPDVVGHWPQPLEGLTYLNGVVFGGRDTLGTAQNGVYIYGRSEQPYTSDYGYHFDPITPFNTSSLTLLPRGDHSAIELEDPSHPSVPDSGLVVFGGRSGSTIRQDTYRLIPVGGGN